MLDVRSDYRARTFGLWTKLSHIPVCVSCGLPYWCVRYRCLVHFQAHIRTKDVPKPTDFGLEYEEPELVTPDGFKLRCYFLVQKKDLGSSGRHTIDNPELSDEEVCPLRLYESYFPVLGALHSVRHHARSYLYCAASRAQEVSRIKAVSHPLLPLVGPLCFYVCSDWLAC